jgi:hypothetical protein
MGLDMYLSARKYIPRKGGYDLGGKAQYPNDTELFNKVIDVLGVQDIVEVDGFAGIEVSIPAIYWRKVNSVHGWFVRNVQGGKDNCEQYSVSRIQLEELRDLCKKVLDTKDAKWLEPTAGFFFGNTEINEWYFGDIQQTYDDITRLLENSVDDGMTTYIYQSSW